ncbi:hypothetical protein [Coleofasciculus sp. H7-2]|uniref:hypothetical protein n=1 Tax=Coleofasciculus sp. H7-2 TaxID=3351545 RepID=UPI00366C2857
MSNQLSRRHLLQISSCFVAGAATTLLSKLAPVLARPARLATKAIPAQNTEVLAQNTSGSINNLWNVGVT